MTDDKALMDKAAAMELQAKLIVMHGGEPSEGQAIMWAQILAEVRYGDAVAAMIEHYREDPRPCTPHDIYRRVAEWWDWWRINGYDQRFGPYDEKAPIGGDWPPSQMLTATQIRQQMAERAALEAGRDN